MDKQMSDKIEILIADDADDIRQILRILLESEGYKVTEASNKEEIFKNIKKSTNLIVLDVNLPEGDGFSICREIRKFSYVPILFLTARDLESDKILGLSAGGDDYITKPFSNGELLARIKTLLRRSIVYQSNIEIKEDNIITIGEIVINADEKDASINGKKLLLTSKEYSILYLFATNRKKIFSLDSIYEKLWQNDCTGIYNNSVMSHIKNLRKKMGDNSRDPKYIKTAWGKGYYID